ncbi:MAG: hypothetical protein VYA23_05275 [Candidatus Thermoplasmatota archaeon]|nr:hypothetical protein [Candidatus Thermoplasmatota archaeon]
MALNHNQYAVAAITVTLCLAGFYTIIDAGLSTTESGGFDAAGSDVVISEDEVQQAGRDSDEDGLPDRMEQTLYGTDHNNPDTDGDGLEDGWEVANGLDPLDSGEPDDRDIENTNADGEDAGEQNETFPDPDNGPYGDPDRDGLTNEQEAAIGTNPTASDSDGDGLNDRWESLYTETVQTPQGPVTLLDPLNPNWGCPLLTPQVEAEMKLIIGTSTWNSLPVGPNGDHSCDSVLDIDRQGPDSLPNYLEEIYDTNPLEEDSDGDLIPDRIEVGYGSQELQVHCGVPQFGTIRLDAPYTDLMSGVGDLTWFNEDMDGDGRLNGPGDWDTDGDGMPDGFEYCYNTLLNPANSTDAYGDVDEDGLNNVEEYEVAYTWGAVNFTNPLVADTDDDGMPDGWEYNSGIHPNDGSNAEEDPDFDGYDADGDGAVRYTDLVGISTVHNIVVEIGDTVQVNRTIMWVRTVQDSQYVNIPIKTPTAGVVYAINVEVGQEVTSRLQDLAIVVEDHERFTNLDEYRAKFSPDTDFTQPEEEWVILGRSTDPLVQDTDSDGLIDGIEVIGWTIRIVDVGVRDVVVYSDPGVYDTDRDGLSDSTEYYETYTNASDRDTDSDGLEDFTEAVDGFVWNGSVYFTNASMFDTDNDGLNDGEEVVNGQDQYITHANNADTDDDGLSDGGEVLFIPRPWQSATNPLDNDTDDDGQPDGWEMQVFSVQQNTNSHSLWITTQNWLPIGCTSMVECGLGPGGWVWDSYLKGFQTSGDRNGDGILDPKYFIYEMNLTGFTIPSDGRWALDPSFGSMPDSNFDIDNDTLLNALEAPDRWDTNPVDDDTDGDLLADGWEVSASERAISLGLVDNNTLNALGARGPMDPRMPDSDLDGIDDGAEDFDEDGLNRTHLLNRYCPGWDDPQNAECHIDPTTNKGGRFYDDLENYTNYEEFQNMTDPVLADTDEDGWADGSEVYHQDHDNDGMWSGWEFYFDFDPFDAADAFVDSDGDGYNNKCENKWNTNPKDPTSFPSQGELCTND